MTRTVVSSKSRAFRVASGMSRAIACAARSVSIARVPARRSAIRVLDWKRAQQCAAARSNWTMRPSCAAMRRSSQDSSRRRLARPDVVWTPASISATTRLDNNVSRRFTNNQSTTRASGTGLVNSLKTFVSTKIIVFEGKLSLPRKTRRNVNLHPRTGHRNQLVYPIIIGAPRIGALDHSANFLFERYAVGIRRLADGRQGFVTKLDRTTLHRCLAPTHSRALLA